MYILTYIYIYLYARFPPFIKRSLWGEVRLVPTYEKLVPGPILGGWFGVKRYVSRQTCFAVMLQLDEEHMHLNAHTYIYIYVHMYICMHAWVHIYTSVFMYTCV